MRPSVFDTTTSALDTDVWLRPRKRRFRDIVRRWFGWRVK